MALSIRIDPDGDRDKADRLVPFVVNNIFAQYKRKMELGRLKTLEYQTRLPDGSIVRINSVLHGLEPLYIIDIYSPAVKRAPEEKKALEELAWVVFIVGQSKRLHAWTIRTQDQRKRCTFKELDPLYIMESIREADGKTTKEPSLTESTDGNSRQWVMVPNVQTDKSDDPDPWIHHAAVGDYIQVIRPQLIAAGRIYSNNHEIGTAIQQYGVGWLGAANINPYTHFRNQFNLAMLPLHWKVGIYSGLSPVFLPLEPYNTDNGTNYKLYYHARRGTVYDINKNKIGYSKVLGVENPVFPATEIKRSIFYIKHDPQASTTYYDEILMSGGFPRYPNATNWIKGADVTPYKPADVSYRSLYTPNFDTTLDEADYVTECVTEFIQTIHLHTVEQRDPVYPQYTSTSPSATIIALTRSGCIETGYRSKVGNRSWSSVNFANQTSEQTKTWYHDYTMLMHSGSARVQMTYKKETSSTASYHIDTLDQLGYTYLAIDGKIVDSIDTYDNWRDESSGLIPDELGGYYEAQSDEEYTFEVLSNDLVPDVDNDILLALACGDTYAGSWWTETSNDRSQTWPSRNYPYRRVVRDASYSVYNYDHSEIADTVALFFRTQIYDETFDWSRTTTGGSDTAAMGESLVDPSVYSETMTYTHGATKNYYLGYVYNGRPMVKILITSTTKATDYSFGFDTEDFIAMPTLYIDQEKYLFYTYDIWHKDNTVVDKILDHNTFVKKVVGLIDMSTNIVLANNEYTYDNLKYLQMSTTGGTYLTNTAIGVHNKPQGEPRMISLAGGSTSTGTSGSGYSYTPPVSGGGGGNVWTLSSGSLPPGMTLDEDTGEISGTAGAAGTYNFCITVTDTYGFSDTECYSITIVAPAITITTLTLPGGTEGDEYIQILATSGGYGTKTWSKTAGTLPDGTSLGVLTGAISGYLGAGGTYNFTIQVSDANGMTDTQAYEVVIEALPIPLAIVPAGGSLGQADNLPTFGRQRTYYYNLEVVGSTGGEVWEVSSGALPAGLSLNTSTGEISGTCSAADGTYYFNIKVTDDEANTDEQSFWIQALELI